VRTTSRGPDESGARLRGPSALDVDVADGLSGDAAVLRALPADVEALHRLGGMPPLVLTLREMARRRSGFVPTRRAVRGRWTEDVFRCLEYRSRGGWTVGDFMGDLEITTFPKPGVLLVADLWVGRYVVSGSEPFANYDSRIGFRWYVDRPFRLGRVGRVFRPSTAWALGEGASSAGVSVVVDSSAWLWLRLGAVAVLGDPYAQLDGYVGVCSRFPRGGG